MTETSAPQPILRIEKLSVAFGKGTDRLTVVDDVSMSVQPGRTRCIVGESGSGKSVLSLAVMNLLPENGALSAGRVLLEDTDLTTLSRDQMRRIRGKRIAMIFQEPMTSLNPLYTVGAQLVEAIRSHFPDLDRKAARGKALDLMRRVRIPAAESRLDNYPHQMSGGMRQRVMIAMALSCEPDVLIADEPTTALDVTVQAQVLDLLRDLQAQTGMAIILITHDLGVVANIADDVTVMYAGRIVEQGTRDEVLRDTQHPYTLGLLGSVPRVEDGHDRLLSIEGTVPPPFDLPPGCRFAPRCVFAAERCRQAQPEALPFGGSHTAACIRAPVELIET